jgi:DNA polymerase I-like protein with 3'-5' exonuclease and polymerase domains
MQQAPSTEQYRKMFVAKPGWKLVDSDYSSAELFIAAYLSGDKQLLFALSKGPSQLLFISNIWPEMVRCRRKC